MPSKRRQFNARFKAEDWDRLEKLQERLRRILKLDLSQYDVVRLGLIELEKRYPPEDEERNP
jgi:hypothetical protein